MIGLDDLVARAEALAVAPGRSILGITGAPGSGKSTLARRIEMEVNSATSALQPLCRVVPMDGFHLSDAVLRHLGRLERKGAVDTFDAHGYLALLRRLVVETGHPVYAPSFHRDLEQPIAAGIVVESSITLAVSEGNYLLMDDPPWPDIRIAMSEVWYCQLDDETRRRRLIARHVDFGKGADEARRWVDAVDERNARSISAWRDRADLVVDMSSL